MPISDQTKAILSVLAWPKIGVAKVRALLKELGPSQNLFELAALRFPESAAHAERDSSKIKLAVDRIMVDCETLDLQIVTLLDGYDYPTRLRSISDPPPVLYVLGQATALGVVSAAVVGTREASEAGRRAARDIGSHFAKRGVCVVSGLALGIDAAAHLGAVDSEGVSVAVLAHGLDTIAPPSNKPIGKRILELGGALVSEHAPGVPPRPPEFARRNRIQSGLARLSVVVESAAEGGAMIHAEYARKQGRPICAVISAAPGFNQDGATRLIKDLGATPVAGLRELDQAFEAALESGDKLKSSQADQPEFQW